MRPREVDPYLDSLEAYVLTVNNRTDEARAFRSGANILGLQGRPGQARSFLQFGVPVDVPFLENRNGAIKYALAGWQLSGIVTYNSGLPLTVTSLLGNDPGRLGSVNNTPSAAGGRPDMVADPNSGSGIHTLNKWFNTAAFAEVPVGVVRPGNAGRGILDAPGIARWDFSIFKQFSIRETAHFQVRVETFNFLNHANFNAPTVVLGNANFGRILGARDPRQIQLGGKLVF